MNLRVSVGGLVCLWCVFASVINVIKWSLMSSISVPVVIISSLELVSMWSISECVFP